MLRHGVFPDAIDERFTQAEFTDFEKYVADVELRDRDLAVALRAFVGSLSGGA